MFRNEHGEQRVANLFKDRMTLKNSVTVKAVTWKRVMTPQELAMVL